MKFILTILFATTAFVVRSQSIEQLVDAVMKQANIPELGYAVISPDSILSVNVYGFHRSDMKTEQTKASLADYFHLGSNTKAITGFIAATLVEKSKIKWTTKCFTVFPEWKKGSNPAYANITLEDLLSHRARIQPYTSGAEYAQLPKFKGNRQEKREAFSHYLLQQPPVTDTTKAWHYSNAGYSIAASMLEKVSGKSWEELVKETLTGKLYIPVYFGWPNQINPAEPYGHWIDNDTLTPLPPNTSYNLALAEPAGDISLTLKGYAKFLQLNLQGLEGQSNVLHASTYQYLHFGLPEYAIGWANHIDSTQQISQHAGSAGTFYCYTLLDKNKKVAYTIIANSGAGGVHDAILKLLAAMKKEYANRDTLSNHHS